MNNTYNGGPAFPMVFEDFLCVDRDSEPERRLIVNNGMTLRDYFAAKAMQGCLAYSYCCPQKGNWQENATVDAIAVFAYQVSDAMLKAREQ